MKFFFKSNIIKNNGNPSPFAETTIAQVLYFFMLEMKKNYKSDIMTKQKRKRGRPKKQPKEIPKFETDKDIREFLISESLRLNIELIDIATKKNNIKNVAVSRAKATQYKTALEGLKTTDSILKNKQIDDIKEAVKRMEANLLTIQLTQSNADDNANEISNAVAELNNLNKELESIKEVV